MSEKIKNYQKYKAAYKAASKRYYEKQKKLGKARNCSYKVKFLSTIKTRAKKNGLEFSITNEDFTIPEFCPVLGIPILIDVGGRTDNSPSMDRYDNSKGYIPGNVHIISWRANRIKSDSTIEEIEAILKYMKGS